jgi:hypothetical protein
VVEITETYCFVSYIYRVPSATTGHIHRARMLTSNENEVPQAILHMRHS